MNKIIIIIASIFGILVVLSIIFTMMLISIFNDASVKKIELETKWEEIGTALEGRYETMSQLISGIQNANQQMLTLQEMITDARAAMLAAQSPEELSEAEGELESAFAGILVLIEDNPGEYATVELYQSYMANATASTNAVTEARNSYNEAVEELRKIAETFPGNIILPIVGFSVDDVEYYTAPQVTIPTF
ncbi:MAG TPA: LemA family protein [Acholeplasma sp.]|jgi:LemA protein